MSDVSIVLVKQYCFSKGVKVGPPSQAFPLSSFAKDGGGRVSKA